MLSKLFDTYKTYIYLVTIVGLILILNTQYSIIEGVKNRKRRRNRCNKQKCRNRCPKNDVECLQKYAECGNCKYSVSSLNDTKQTNIYLKYKQTPNKHKQSYHNWVGLVWEVFIDLVGVSCTRL